MKYILITKLENGESTEKVYSSIRKIAQELGTTYCSCYSNFLDSVEPSRKPSKKLSQVIFNKKYKFKSLINRYLHQVIGYHQYSS